mgnify:CR=1 FL=1
MVSLRWIAISMAAVIIVLTGPASAREDDPPNFGRDYPILPLWGDTHLHTQLSMDAGAMGTLRTVDDAYRFARGEEVVSTSGVPAKLSRPLDFLVVADHSDAMGTVEKIIEGDPYFGTDSTVARWQAMIRSGNDEKLLQAAFEIVGAFGAREDLPAILLDKPFARKTWDSYTRKADQYYEPGRFTSLIGYEWTSMPGWNNLHRVVIYRDGADKVGRMLPALVADGVDPERLWDWMRQYEDVTGGDVLAIPHNGNTSEGLMFANARFDGSPITTDYAKTRQRWEPIYETTQVKGDSETHPLLSPNDEFADYETWDDGNFYYDGADPATLPGDYTRSGLKRGLELDADVGANPFKYGLIGSTDSHTGLATAGENNFFGKFVNGEPQPGRWRPWTKTAKRAGWEYAASGLAAVWAGNNTREAIFDAMERREVYATTGSRITLRFFAGWIFSDGDARTRQLADVGYRKGVPMGADLSHAPDGATATFLVAAAKDPEGGNLDRIQIIKGWLDKSGKSNERVYDVVWSDERQAGSDGNLPDVGNTVDIANATWTNTIGDPELVAVWRDPEFDPLVRAFYYARVLEIPTPRWTAYDAKRFGDEMPDEVPMITRERAYSSPIWYTP